MSDILTSCADELSIDKFQCAPTLKGFPNKLVFMHTEGNSGIAGDAPTLAEIVAGIAASGLDKMVLIEQFTNGQRVEASRDTFTGADTADGLTDVSALYFKITGKIKMLGERLIADLLTLSRQQTRLQMWVITDQGYILGGKTGYRTANFFTPEIMEGYGTQNYIAIDHTYQVNLNQTDPAGFDLGFKDLVNPDIS